MLKWLALLLGIAHAQTVALPPTYIIFPSQAACLTRSQQMCTAMGCDGVHTKYWWDCGTALNAGNIGPTAVPAGSFAMRIDNGTQFGATASNNVSGGTQGLTAQEQSSSVTATAIAPLIPTGTAVTLQQPVH